MKHIVGVAEMAISTDPADVLITHALGSCLGIAVYDARAGIGGLLHAMLPLSSLNPEKAADNPFMFVDTGMPCFLNELYNLGADRTHLRVAVAGGAAVNNSQKDRFSIGKRNFIIFKKLMWRNGILIGAQEVGGNCARTMRLEMDTGRVVITSGSETRELQPAQQRGGARNAA